MVPQSKINLRPAGSNDEAHIKRMVRAARINPTSLDWERFVLATTPAGEIVGCGQIKPHRDGTRELASIVVEPHWRGQGIARQIIEHLVVSHPGTLYLTCRGGLESLYTKFGFVSLSQDEMPPYFRRIYRLVSALGVLGLAQEGLRVMRLLRP